MKRWLYEVERYSGRNIDLATHRKCGLDRVRRDVHCFPIAKEGQGLRAPQSCTEKLVDKAVMPRPPR